MSASVWSASEARGSWERRCLEEGDEVRDRKEGGGEDGIALWEVGVIGLSSSSCAFIYSTKSSVSHSIADRKSVLMGNG